MKNKNNINEQTVQATMLLAIYGRAKARKLYPTILRDADAERIVDGMDYDFSLIDKSYGTEYACLCCLARAKRLDERCQAYIKEHPHGTVVNLGSGLDTTFSRVDNGTIRWYNVDLPDSIAFRQSMIPPADRVTDIAKSMLDYTWFDDIQTEDGSVFVLAGGLFYYFHEEEVRDLVRRIADHFDHGEIFFDAQSKRAIKISNRKVRKAGNKGSEMYFYINDLQALKAWSPKIREVSSVKFFGEDGKNKRYSLTTKIAIWGLESFKMGFLVSIKW